MTATLIPANTQRTKALEVFEALGRWPHWQEIAWCARKEYGLSAEQFHLLLPEYQKFLSLAAAYPGVGMVSVLIDTLWHSHILHTMRYEEVCRTIIGYPVHHLPCSSYALYGVEQRSAGSECSTCKLPSIPTTCYGQVSPHGSQSETRESIVQAGQNFVKAYTQVFGPVPAIWECEKQSPHAEGIALAL